MRVFVVEDHADTLKWLIAYLEILGHDVSSARSVYGAREMLAERRYDVLLSDLQLGDGTGWELLLGLRLPKPIYAIAMTAYASDESRHKSQLAGFRHHLLKPLKLSDLDAALLEATQEINA